MHINRIVKNLLDIAIIIRGRRHQLSKSQITFYGQRIHIVFVNTKVVVKLDGLQVSNIWIEVIRKPVLGLLVDET